MKRWRVRWIWITALALTAGVLPAAVCGAADQILRLAQPNAARFPEVTLYAFPTDARGVLLGGLGASDFHVTENGQPGEVVRVDTRSGSLDVALALDCSRSMIADEKLESARAA